MQRFETIEINDVPIIVTKDQFETGHVTLAVTLEVDADGSWVIDNIEIEVDKHVGATRVESKYLPAGNLRPQFETYILSNRKTRARLDEQARRTAMELV